MAAPHSTAMRTTLSTNTAGSNLLRDRYVDDLIEIMSEQDVPFTKLIGIDGEAINQKKFEWETDELLAETETMVSGTNGGGNMTAVEATPLVTILNAYNFQEGSIIKIDNEIMGVTAINSATTMTLDRSATKYGTNGTGHANVMAIHVAGAEIKIIGIAVQEGIDAPRKGSTVPTFSYNVFQIFNTSFQMAWAHEDSPMFGISNDFDYQLEKAFKELSIKLEQTALLGKRVDEAAGVAGKMGGLDSFISTNTTDLAGAALSEKTLMDELQDLFYLVGPSNMARTILCGAWAKRTIASWYAPMTQRKQEQTKAGVLIDTIDSEFGPLNIKMLPRIPKNALYLVNLDFLKIHPFAGRGRWNDSELSTAGAYRTHMLYGMYSLKVKNEKAMAKISNFAST